MCIRLPAPTVFVVMTKLIISSGNPVNSKPVAKLLFYCTQLRFVQLSNKAYDDDDDDELVTP